jgi:hypothetical protein
MEFKVRPMDCKNNAHYMALMYLHYLSLCYTPIEDIPRLAENYHFWLRNMDY